MILLNSYLHLNYYYETHEPIKPHVVLLCTKKVDLQRIALRHVLDYIFISKACKGRKTYKCNNA